MVSNFKYYSGKGIDIRKAVPFSVVVLILFIVILVINLADNLPELLFLSFLAYLVSGYISSAHAFLKRKS